MQYKRLTHALAALTLSFCATASFTTNAHSQAKVGSTGMQSLELEVSARGMAMGGAFIAVVDDVSAVFYNPAGLPYLFYKEAMFTQVVLPSDMNLSFFAVGLPMESIGGVLGIGGSFLSTGDILETTYNRPNGTGRFFSAGEYALTLSYGRYLTDRFSVGFTMKYLGSDLADVSANGWAADIGTIYNTGFRDFKVAMSITNFGPDMTHIKNAAPLPINFHFGASVNLVESSDHLAVFSMEGSHPADNLEKYQGGMEYWYNDKYSIRAGVRLNRDLNANFEIVDGAIQRTSGVGLAFGGGLRLPFGEEREMRFDYAFQDYEILTQVHRFTFSIVF
jgi:hypothetical protein